MGECIAIVHFQPPEAYPPIVNLSRYLATGLPNTDIVLITSKSSGDRKIELEGKSLRIYRYGVFGRHIGSLKRYLNYVFFYTAAVFRLCIERPGRVVYIESLSALPVYLYRKFINRRAKVFIHYHEYVTPGEYASGMSLVRWIHAHEGFLYGRASWISQTNGVRLRMFANDEGINGFQTLRELPNYPPATWKRNGSVEDAGIPVKFVYVGAVDMHTMYIVPFANWINEQGGKAIWHIYSNNIDDKSRSYLEGEGNELVRLYEAVDYDELPSILKDYDVGVILYKGHIPNFVHNAPNKLFEYLAVGLDVWYPVVMEGIHPYRQEQTRPGVFMMEFEDMDNFDLDQWVAGRTARKEVGSEYFCERVYKEFLNALTDGHN